MRRALLWLVLAVSLWAPTPALAADVSRFKRGWAAASKQPQGEARDGAQLTALIHLTQGTDAKAAAVLLKLCIDPRLSPKVRDTAEAGLVAGGKQADVALWMGEAIAGKERKAPCRVILCQALGARAAAGDPQAGVLLLRALNDKKPEVLSAAAIGLAPVKKKAVVSGLVGLLQRAKGRVKGDVRRSLQELTGTKHGSPAEWESWWAVKKSSFSFDAKPGKERPAGQRFRTLTRLAPPGKGGKTLYEEIESNHVLFVIDVSGSMQVRTTDLEGRGRSRLEYVKESLIAAIDAQLQDSDTFALIAFGSKAQAFKNKPLKANAANRKKAKSWVRSRRVAGGTNVYAALALAFSVPKVDTIYFLSDGSPSEGKTIVFTELLAQVRKWNAGRGVRICTIGFLAGDGSKLGIPQDKGMAKSFLKGLAKDNDGTARFFE